MIHLGPFLSLHPCPRVRSELLHIHYLPADSFSSDRLAKLEVGNLDPGMLADSRIRLLASRNAKGTQVYFPA